MSEMVFSRWTVVPSRVLLLFVSLAVILTADRTFTAEPAIQQQARVARQKALAKQRRIFFNDDTYELSRDDADTPEGYLKRRLKPLAGTQVDVISWSVLGGWADAPVYDSKVQPIYGDAHGGPSKYWTKVTKNVKALTKTGRCPLQVTIDFAHDNGMELFASIRMNDCHDSFIPGGITLWKKEHPEFWVDVGDVPADKDAHPLGLYVTAQDFAHAEVRERKFEIIAEVCQRYDIDGVDLNFMRHPVFFSRTMRGESVTEQELEIMTGLVRRIRKLTDQRGLERGRPILLAAIVPDRLEQAQHIGLDVTKWIDEDLIDIVIPGLGYSPFSTPVKDYVDLAHRRGVQVYPCINRKAPQKVPDELVSEGFRGVTAKWYAAGADGIFFWNLGTPFEFQLGEDMQRIRERYYATLSELGDPATVSAGDKLYAVDDPVLSYYQHVATASAIPVSLKPGQSEQLAIVVSDDLSQAAASGRLDDLKLLVWFKQPGSAPAVVLQFNERELAATRQVGQDAANSRSDYPVPPSVVKLGSNTLKVSLAKNPLSEDSAVELVHVYLLVRYRQPGSSSP